MKRIILIQAYLIVVFSCFSQTTKEEYNNCAIAYTQAGEYELALTYFTKVIELSPKDSIAYFDRGMVKEFLHDYKGAINDFSEQIAIDKVHADSYFLRGTLYFKLADYSNAVSDFSRVTSIDADNADAHFYLALSLVELKKYKRALKEFNECIKLYDSNAEYFQQRGNLYKLMNKLEKAELDYKKSNEIQKINTL